MRYVKLLVVLLPAWVGVQTTPSALAHETRTGGAAMPGGPSVRSVACVERAGWTCGTGEPMTILGEDLRQVRSVTFAGRAGRSDDRSARPRATTPHSLSITVPTRARTGPLVIRSRFATASRTRRAVRIAAVAAPQPTVGLDSGALLAGGERKAVFRYRAPADASADASIEAIRLGDGAPVMRWPVAPAPDGSGVVEWDGTVKGVPQPSGRYAFRVAGSSTAQVSAESGSDVEFSLVEAIFPIRGEHDMGQSAANTFGGGRGHKGLDMFAACGTPLVAAQSGRVATAQYHSAAGYYVVIKRSDGQSHGYMHLKSRALVKEGQQVTAGQPIGEVGQSGRASGCHLHFELWTAPGWYSGGKAVDPEPTLRRWKATG